MEIFTYNSCQCFYKFTKFTWIHVISCPQCPDYEDEPNIVQKIAV